ncbi:rod shape-determining protein RodA [Parvibium lacunae]|uniref:Peptidoglycan glycosyltransferase MrdB n=1 Tax=Parvibium lacunae TaxID=1888893 RepID=A0A368L501_9BURK|nr:rod shape-determining protein RodA [Parvibium lacunae]RCS58595.1 rod shape-determining protein RodA [Parvibium lacunae]
MPYINVFDLPLLTCLALIAGAGLIIQYSASYDFPGRYADVLRNLLIAVAVMWVVANVTPIMLMRSAVPIYLIGLLLLIAVALFGDISKGARRWLHIGVTRIQPSEIMKIAMPLMLAWYFHKRESMTHWWDFIIAAVILLVPTALIAKQPDLGTALLVAAAGLAVIYFAGLSWRLIVVVVLGMAIGITALIVSKEKICQPDVAWYVLHDYQKHRVCTLLDPTTDPRGKGFHTIQSTIAVGSGGMAGKGLMKGTQTHLEFIPERTTDFIFAVYAEELGLVGCLLLLLFYTMFVARALMIAASAPTLFTRLLAGAIALIFFAYAFVNMGMVSGILPVVGVPLPLISYGGTAFVTLGLGAGILMSIHRHRKLIQS